LETEKDSFNHQICSTGYEQNFEVVLQKIANNGLIVTDGSNSGKEYDFFKYSQWNKDLFSSAVKKDGNSFKCLGKTTRRYDETLVWQIEKQYSVKI
jgi:hypothetical protein